PAPCGDTGMEVNRVDSVTEQQDSTPWSSKPLALKLASVLALAMAGFHLYTSISFPLERGVQRSLHLLFVLALIFLLYPVPRRRWLDGLWGLAGIVTCGYIAVLWHDISLQGGIPWGQ